MGVKRDCVFIENRRRGEVSEQVLVWGEAGTRECRVAGKGACEDLVGSVLPVYRLWCVRAVTGRLHHRREEGKEDG